MNLHYFIRGICDELGDARAYLTNATEVKAMNPEWSKWFSEMSMEEAKHAANLYAMLQQYYTTQSKYYTEQGKEVPSSMAGKYKEITDHYLECTAKLKAMKDMI